MRRRAVNRDRTMRYNARPQGGAEQVSGFFGGGGARFIEKAVMPVKDLVFPEIRQEHPLSFPNFDRAYYPRSPIGFTSRGAGPV